MKLPFAVSRRNGSIIAGVAVLGLIVLITALWLSRGGSVKYPGLQTKIEVEMDAATRAYLEERVAVTKAAIAAQEARGEKVDLDLYMTLAGDAYSSGDLVTAREVLEKQLKGNNINYTAWNLYGTVLEDMGDLKGAEKAYRQAINLGGDIEEFYRDLVLLWQVHFPARRNDIRALLEEMAAKQQTPWNMIELARWYGEEGDCERAIAHYKVARTLSPGNVDIQNEMQEAETSCVAK